MSPRMEFDDRELRDLAADLGRVPGRIVPAVSAVVKDSAEALETGWRDNARESSGAHGVHYPDSISTDLKFGFGTIAAEVGPDASKPQGGMSFELGSKNQPPHLDGARATDAVEPGFIAALAAAAAKVVESA